MNGAKSGAAKICRWSCRHAVLLALVLLLSTIIVPRKVQGQLPSPCCAHAGGGSGNDQHHPWQRDWRRVAGDQRNPQQYQ